MTARRFIVAVLAAAALAFDACAQTNSPTAVDSAALDKAGREAIARREHVRVQCLEGRRSICGKIMRVLPGGLVIDCGYTNLVRGALTKSWLVPGSAVASRAENLVEENEPGAVCVGTIYLTDLPPRGKPHQYDYVILAGFPVDDYTYHTVGTIQKTVRHFSANLDKAVREILAETAPQAAATK